MSDKNHPGWAVQFDDGAWLAYGHGFIKTHDASLAKLYNSVAQAQEAWLEFAYENRSVEHPYHIRLGWEPLCEKLRSEVEDLRNANSIDTFELFMQTETIKVAVREIERMNKTYLSKETTNKDKE